MNDAYQGGLDPVLERRLDALSRKEPDPHPGSTGDKVLEYRILGIVSFGFDPHPGSSNDKILEERLRRLVE